VKKSSQSKKRKKSREREEKPKPRAKVVPERGGARRGPEILGICCLALAMLLGPSLFSVQFGRGDLMGPLGQMAGAAINACFGLGGYLVALTLVIVALRLFSGLVRSRETPPRNWRRLGGVMLILLSAVILAHLIARPIRFGGASAGGLVGEWAAELLCALFHTVGSWVIVFTMMAMGLLIATEFSFVQSLVRLSRGIGASKIRPREVLARLPSPLARTWKTIKLQLMHLRRQQELAADASAGTATMPPVLRLDLSGASETDAAPKKKRGSKKKPITLPEDLEIEAVEPPPPPQILIPEVEPELDVTEAPAEVVAKVSKKKPPQAKVAQTGNAPSPSSEVRSPNASAADASSVTIIESEFESAQNEGTTDVEPVAREVDKPDGPGFVLTNGSYTPPPLTLLKIHGGEKAKVDREAIYEQAKRVVTTLADYKIQGSVRNVHPGPVVTMYEFVPAAGTRISKVAALSNDLAMSLCAEKVRIVAPIPGKGAIGIEVPNGKRAVVSFKEVVADKTFRESEAKLPLGLGTNIYGAPVTTDLSRMPHLLVAGATGAGKSVSINAMLCSLLLKCTPEEVRMIMVDPKKIELEGYNDIPHLLLPVVTDPKKANIALSWAVAEMERRYQLLSEAKVRDILSFNTKVDRERGKIDAFEEQERRILSEASIDEAKPSRVLVVRKNADGSESPMAGLTPTDSKSDVDSSSPKKSGEADSKEPAAAKILPRPTKKRSDLKRLPYIVVVIDEFADLMMAAPKDVETAVARLAQKARAAGIHVILATQRPSVDVITGVIKANFPSRIAFRVPSNHDSKTILGSQGAETLLGSGDMLILDRGDETRRLHGAYISADEIDGIIRWVKEQGKPVYNMDILRAAEEEEAAAELPPEDHDVFYDQAVALVSETRQASISMIQRRLRIGYNRAARMVERMEREGIVGPPDGPRGREVLIQHQTA